MNKPIPKISVLAITLFSLLALAPRAATATPPPDGWSIDLGHLRLCMGDVDRSADCDLHLRGERDATRPEVAAAKPAPATPSWAVLPIPGFTMCFGDVPPLFSLSCDFELSGEPSPGDETERG